MVGDLGRTELATSAEEGARNLFASVQRLKALPDHLEVLPSPAPCVVANVTLELVGLVVSAWHPHVLNEAGSQERHQWFCPRTLVPPVLTYRRALHKRLRQLGEACCGLRAPCCGLRARGKQFTLQPAGSSFAAM
jgi:hypothetical protein